MDYGSNPRPGSSISGPPPNTLVLYQPIDFLEPILPRASSDTPRDPRDSGCTLRASTLSCLPRFAVLRQIQSPIPLVLVHLVLVGVYTDESEFLLFVDWFVAFLDVVERMEKTFPGIARKAKLAGSL
jgi:hypothetical protein